MDSTSVPSGLVVAKLAEYADLLAKFGPDSTEAVDFRGANKHLPLFETNAQQVYQLEKEDYVARAKWHKPSQK